MNDDVVRVLQIPVVQHRHQNLQALKLVHADERVLLPLPRVEPLPSLRPRLEADIREAVALASFNLLLRLRAGDVRARNEVVDLRDIPRRPDDSHRSRLRLRLLADLRDPLAPRSVPHAILLRPAALFFFDEPESAQVWTPVPPARPVEEVERFDVVRAPH